MAAFCQSALLKKDDDDDDNDDSVNFSGLAADHTNVPTQLNTMIKSLKSVCECDLSNGRNFGRQIRSSSLASKSQIFTPIMHFQWECLNTACLSIVEVHRSNDASRRPPSRSNPLFSPETQIEVQYIFNGICLPRFDVQYIRAITRVKWMASTTMGHHICISVCLFLSLFCSSSMLMPCHSWRNKHVY